MNLCIPAEEEVIVSIIKECLLFRFLIYSIPETFKGKPLSQRGIFSTRSLGGPPGPNF